MSARARVDLEWPTHNAVELGDETYFCLERDGRLYVIASHCPHRGGPLHLGRVDDGFLTCPWHGTAFLLDRLCARSVPTVRVGAHVVTYPPRAEPSRAEPSPSEQPLAVHRMVLAHERQPDV